MVTFDEFARLEIRVGRIVSADDHEQARKPMYRLTVDLGPEVGKRTIVAGIKAWYAKEELVGKEVACIVNLDPKTIAGVESRGMLLAAGDGVEALSLLTVDRQVSEGSMVR